MRYEHDRWNQPSSPFYPYIQPGGLGTVNKFEFEALKKEVEELKALLIAAKKFDDATGQPECEAEDKVALIKKIADIFGVDMKDAL